MGWSTEQTLRSLLQYWLPMEDVWFSFSSLTLSPHHTHRQTAKSYVALGLNSFARWKCLRASCESYPVSSMYCTQRLLRHPFPIYSGGALQRAFVEHTVSFIGQTLNLKAWWGVYWSPDPVLRSLNWFMDSISGAQAAGVHVGVHTKLTGIHQPDQVSSAAPPCSTLARPLQMLLALSPAWPTARLYADACTHTHTHLQRLADIHEDTKSTCTKKDVINILTCPKLQFHYTNCVSFRLNAKWG